MFLFIWYVFTVSLLIIPLIIIILWLWCPSQLSCSTNSTGYLSPPTSNSYKVTLSTMNYRCKESPSIFCLYWYSNLRPYGSQPLHWPLGHILGSTFFSFFFFFWENHWQHILITQETECKPLFHLRYSNTMSNLIINHPFPWIIDTRHASKTKIISTLWKYKCP